MPSVHNQATDSPTPEEERRWNEEAEQFRYHEGNPRAPQDSNEYRGWGIPPEKFPPGSAFEYVIAKYREMNLGLRDHDPRSARYIALHPAYKWSFLLSCMAHFLWFRTPAGAKWIMGLYGIHEVKPFYEGYAYFWRDPRQKEETYLDPPVYKDDPATGRKVLVSGVEIHISRNWERNMDPACSVDNRRPMEEMKKLVGKYRSPYAGGELSMPDDPVFYWVSEILRDWLLEPSPNKDWPTRKASRICGWQWVKNLERAPGVKFYEAGDMVNLYKGRAYRLRGADNGVYWCGGSEILIVPLKDLYLLQNTMSEPDVDAIFRCPNCRKRKACVPYTGESHRCCHCYAVEIERGERPTLAKCTMNRECKACPDVINSHTELVELTNRLNRPARTGPVPR